VQARRADVDDADAVGRPAKVRSSTLLIKGV